MRVTPENLLWHELIGLRARVVRSRNRAHEGLRGRVVDETMKTLVLETPRGRRTIPKEDVVLELELPGGERVLVRGSSLVGRPEDRLKRRLRGW